MFKFKYQTENPYDFYPPKELAFTCFVPAGWLSMDLPTVQGCVNYATHREELVECGPNILEFSEVTSSDAESKIISLDIFNKGTRCFEKPAVINCSNVVRSELGVDVRIELALLNHLMGWSAISSWFSVDMDDFIEVMKSSTTYDFRYGIGKTPSYILPALLDREIDKEVRSEFFMIFGANQKMRLKDLEGAVDEMFASSAEDSLKLVGAAGVEEDEMLISVLLGR